MFRIKLIILFLIVIAGIAGLTTFFLGGVSRSIETGTEVRINSAKETVRLANRVHEYSLVTAVESIASRPSVVRGMQCPATEEALREQRREQTPQLDADGAPVRNALGQMVDTEGRPILAGARFECSRTAHQEMLRVMRAWSEEQRRARERYEGTFLSDRGLGFASPGDPDLLLAVDRHGVVVARVGHDMDNWYGPTRPNMNQHPVVGRTESFGVQHDFIAWRERDAEEPRLAQIAAAPVFTTPVEGEREFLGSILVGYLVTNSLADDMSQLTAHTDVAFFFQNEGQIAFPGTSLASRERLRQHLVSGPFRLRALGAGSEGDELALRAVLEQPGTLFETEFDGRSYMLTSATFSRQEGDPLPLAGAVVVSSITDGLEPVQGARLNMILVAFFFFLIGIVGVVLVIKQMMQPIEEISKGIQEVIAGNKDYMWPVEDSNYLCDMSHSLNILSARLQGKPDPDADEAAGGGWGGSGAASPGGEQAAGASPQPQAGGIAGLGGLRGRSARKDEGEGTEG